MGRRGKAVLENLITTFTSICEVVKINFTENFYFLYDKDIHNQILKLNERTWEVVAPSKMLFNNITGKEVDLFNIAYRRADSRVQKQLRNHAKKFIFGENNILEETVKDAGKELNLSFDMLKWLNTNPLTVTQKRISDELNLAATPFILKSLYTLAGITQEKKEFESIAKEHAKALIWMEFAAKKDQKKLNRLNKENIKFQKLLKIEKKEKEEAQIAQRQAEEEAKQAQEQKEKAEDERDRLGVNLSMNLDYSNKEEIVKIVAMDGSKIPQNIVCGLTRTEKRSLFSSKNCFPISKKGKRTDVMFCLIPRTSIVKKTELGQIIVSTLSTQPTFANDHPALTPFAIKEAEYWVNCTFEDMSTDQKGSKTYIIAGVTSADVNSVHPVLCTGKCQSTCLNFGCDGNGPDLKIRICYAASVTVHSLDKINPCFKVSAKLPKPCNVHIDYEVGLLGRGLHARLCKFIEHTWPSAIFHSIFRTNGIHALCSVSEQESFTTNVGQAVYTAGVEKSVGLEIADAIKWYNGDDHCVLVKPVRKFRYEKGMRRDEAKIADFNFEWRQESDNYAKLDREDMKVKRKKWKKQVIEENKAKQRKRKRSIRTKNTLSMRPNGNVCALRRSKRTKFND